MSPLSLLLAVDSHFWIRSAINASLLGVLGWLALRSGCTRGQDKRPWIFILILTLSLFCLRYPILFYPGYIQIDEAQMLSQAITFHAHPIPWVDVDGTTSGPFNSYVLLWCVPFGLHPNYITTRLFGLFCVASMLGFLYLTCQRIAGTFVARLSILPTFLFYSFVTFYDWVHYTSEHFSLFLLGWIIYLMIQLKRNPDSLFLISLLGLLLGIVPFAKLQSILPAGFLGLIGLGILIRHGRFKSSGRKWLPVLWLIGSAILPGLVLLTIVGHSGGLYDFWQSYIRLGSVYVGEGHTLRGRFHLVQTLFLNPRNDLAFLVYLSAILAVGLFVNLLFGKLKITRSSCKWLAFSTAFTFVTVITAVFPGFAYMHYGLYLTIALPLLTAACLRILRTALRSQPAGIPQQLRGAQGIALAQITVILACLLVHFVLSHSQGHQISSSQSQVIPLMYLLVVFSGLLGFLSYVISRSLGSPSQARICIVRKWAVFIYAFIFLLLPAVILAAELNPYAGNVSAFLSAPPQPIDLAILHVRRPGYRLAIWGYEPDFTAETETVQGTRDSIDQFEIFWTPLQSYYRERYLRDMQVNRPELFLEAVGPHNFGFEYLGSYGMETFPELAKYIQDHYQLCEVIDGMRLFIRSDLSKTDSSARPGTHP